MTRLATISDPSSFHEEARYQRVCAICGRAGGRPDFRGRTWHAHHVLPRRLLRRLKLPEWDTRNALRLCTDCHMSSEWAGASAVKIAVADLKDDNICYAFEVLGATVVQLERTYGDFEADERWARHLTEGCELCQRT